MNLVEQRDKTRELNLLADCGGEKMKTYELLQLYLTPSTLTQRKFTEFTGFFFQSIVFLLLEFTGLVRFISVRMSSIVTGLVSDPSYVL